MSSGLKIFMKGSFVSVIATIILGAINYLTRRTMALNLDRELYGFFYSAFSLSMLVVIFIDLGFNQSATILISKHLAGEKRAEAKSIFWNFALMKFVLSSLSAFILFLFTDLLMSKYFHFPQGGTVFLFFCFLLVATALTGIVTSTLDAYQQYTVRNFFQIGGVIITFLGVLLGIKKYPLQGPVLSYTFSASIIVLLGIIYLRINKPFLFTGGIFKHLGLSIKEFWKVGKWITIATASMSAMYYMDTVMLTYLSNLESVALYNIALPIMRIYQGFLVFPLILTPIVSRLWHQDRKAELKGLIKRINLVGICVLIVSIIVLYAYPVNKKIIFLLFSPDFEQATASLNILCVGMLILGLGQLYSNTLMAVDRARAVALINLVAAAVNFCANIILIPIYDIRGAAMATALSYLLLSIGCGLSLRRILAKIT